MPEPVTRENFFVPASPQVAAVEAGSHTLASANAGVELGGWDVHGLSGQPRRQWRIVLNRFAHQRLSMIGLGTFALLGLASVLVGHFWRYSSATITNNLNVSPSWGNPFGTNSIGNDMFAQVMAGLQKDIEIALTVAVIATLIGVTVGALAGFHRGWVDSVLMRFVDLVLVLPVLAVLIVLANKLSKESDNWLGLAVIIGLLSWTYVARLVRADFLSLRERDFVEAARALGATNRRIIVRHMLPNAIGPIIVNATLTVALSIVLESTLSFLGLGVQPPNVSLGLLVEQGQDSATTEWWLFVFPVACLIILILSIFLVGDGIREAFDPKKGRGEGPVTDTVLEVESLEVDFPVKDAVVHAVRGVDFSLSPGEVLGIVGESGSGKSATALATMGLLPRATEVRGSVRFRGDEILGLKEKQLTKVHGRGIAMIFQDPMTSLNPVYTVGWQIAEAILAHQDVSKDVARTRAVELMAKVGIPDPARRADDYPHQFSGGMRQRAVIAIAMANDPDVILADEPTTALDVTVQAQVLDSLRTALTETGAALLLITHDLGVIAGLADRVMVMYAGRVVESGTAEDVFYRPSMPYTVGLLASVPRLDDSTERLRQIPGSPPSMQGRKSGCPFAARCPLVVDVCREHEPDLTIVPSVTSAPGHHRAACHFAVEVGRGDHGRVFSDGVVDTEIP